MSKSGKMYKVVLSNGLIYKTFSLSEAKRVYDFLCAAFPNDTVSLTARLM